MATQQQLLETALTAKPVDDPSLARLLAEFVRAMARLVVGTRVQTKAQWVKAQQQGDRGYAFAEPMTVLVNQSRRQAVEVAASYLERAAAAQGVQLPARMVVRAADLDVSQTSRVFDYAGPGVNGRALRAGDAAEVSSAKALAQIEATVGRYTADAGRLTVERTMESDELAEFVRRQLNRAPSTEPAPAWIPEQRVPQGRTWTTTAWARVTTSPNPCSFCVMLASRGMAYASQKTATTTKRGLRYHDHCMCTAVPVFDSENTSLPQADAYYKLWLDLTKGYSGAEARRVFRKKMRELRAAGQVPTV